MKDRFLQEEWPRELRERTSVEIKKYLSVEALRIGINIDCTIAEATRSGIFTDDNLACSSTSSIQWPQYVLKNWPMYSREARLLAVKWLALDADEEPRPRK